MAEVILHGVGASSYVRTCRLALEEKGVAYTLDPAMPNSPEQIERHPWGKVPALTHGNVRLYESLAITRYVDEAFDGPALQPADPADRARMMQWISVLIDYMYTPIVRQIIIQRLVVDKPDEGVIDAAKPPARKCLDELDRQLAATPYLAGSAVSLADLFVLPVINYLAIVPEGAELLDGRANIAGWAKGMEDRTSARTALAA